MSVYSEIAIAIYHTVPHTIIETVQGKTVSIRSLFYFLNRTGLKQCSNGCVGIYIHRHSADARRPGWIDLTMKTTTNSCQTSHISYIKMTCIPQNEENSQNKRNFFDGSAVIETSLYSFTQNSLRRRVCAHGYL